MYVACCMGRASVVESALTKAKPDETKKSWLTPACARPMVVEQIEYSTNCRGRAHARPSGYAPHDRLATARLEHAVW